MKIFNSLIPSERKSAVALGYFDGVHLGHQRVIRGAADEKKNGLCTVVFTFEQRPLSVIDGRQQENITQKKEKHRLIEQSGADILYSVDFNLIKDISPKEFVKAVLCDTFNAKKVFCGFNYHFGKNGEGDSDMLKSLCKEQGIEVFTVAPVLYDGFVVSSTRIRKLIKDGNINEANRLLGHRYGYSAQITQGNHIGRKIETPTINQQFEEGFILPRFGVYATVVTINGKEYCGVTNIGVKPTIGTYSPLSETWLPEYSGESLYGKTVDVRLLEFIRPEKKFDSLHDLQTAIIDNGKTAAEIFDRYKESEKA
ncbi:MAG: bifunctional riboflavin kinase/FAD synthetase [Acutalibacteraceae bacterium]